MNNRDWQPDADLLGPQLEHLHQQMLDGEDLDNSSDSQLDCARQMFDLIERVRQHKQAAAIDDQVETHRGSMLDTDCERLPGELLSPESVRQIGRFSIERLLGQGGNGFVFLAFDPQLGRQVALKIPRPETLLATQSKERFLCEAKAAAMLAHPNIVPVFEIDQLGSVIYIITPFIDGPTLSQKVDDLPANVMAPHDAAMIVGELADAVQHAHSRGVLHRDLKPSNILFQQNLSETNHGEQPLITDFGLAKVLSDESEVTQEGDVVGTPSYMSPEQARGIEVGPATDIYSLGAILYRLLTGQNVFEKSSIAETLVAIQQQEPTRPGKLNPRVPRDLEAICLKCLEKKPVDRYSSAYHLQQDLKRFSEGHAVVARRVGPVDRVRKWASRNPAMAVALTLIFVSISCGLFVSLWQWNRAESNMMMAVEQRAETERHMARVEQVIDQMLTDVANVLRYIPQMAEFREELLRQAMTLQQELISEDSDSPRTQLRMAQALRRLTKIQQTLGQQSDSIESANKAFEMLDQITEPSLHDAVEEERINISLEVVGSYYLTDDWEKAETVIRSAIDSIGSPSDVHQSAKLARAQRSLGMVLMRRNQNDAAMRAFEQAKQISQQMVEANQSGIESQANYYRVLNSLGVLHRTQGNNTEAEVNYLDSIEINSNLVDEHPERIDLRFDLSITSLNFGNFLFRLSKYDEALDFYGLSSLTAEKLKTEFENVPRFRSIYASAQMGRGVALRRSAQPNEAIEAYHLAIADLNRIDAEVGATPVQLQNIARAYNNIGLAKKDLGLFEEAIEDHDKGIAVLHRLVEKFPTDIEKRLSLSRAQGNLGLLIKEMGNNELGKEKLLEGMQTAQSCVELNAKHEDARTNFRWHKQWLCEVHCRLGEHAMAWQFAEELVALHEPTAESTLQAARVLARCVEIIEAKETTIPPNQDDADQYAEKAISWLSTALTLSDQPTDAILADAGFDSLRGFDSFQALDQ